jgi:hypothetical protein
MKTISVLFLAILFFGCGGYKSPTQAPPQAGIVPVLSGLMPNSVNAGAQGFTLTVNGNNFNTNAVVNWGGAQQTTTYVTGKQLTTAIPAAAVATAGTVAVTVTHTGSSTPGGPYGGGSNTPSETSSSLTFTIN